MRAGKGCEQTIFREQLERAQVQFAITAQGVAQPAPRFRERWWIEDDEVVFGFRFLSAAQESEHVLLDPAHFQSVAFRVLFPSRNVLGTFFNRGDVGRAGARTSEGKRAL